MFMEKNFYKKLIKIAAPIAVQNLIMSSINLADVFMIGKLGEAPLAALGLANQIMFLLVLLLFGINSGSGVFIAQFWGKGDTANIHKVLGLTFLGSILTVMLFFMGSQFIPETLIRIYSPDQEVVDLGGTYLKIVGWSYIFTAISFIFCIQLRSVGVPKLGMYSSSLSLFVNVTLNYILIFGKLGFPALGVAGAAIATAIARLIECVFVVGIVYLQKYPLAVSFKNMFGWDRDFLNLFYKTTFPVVMNEMLWALGITTYSMVYARMSTTDIAVINIVGSIERIAFTGFIGVANAAAIMVGNKIGESNEEKAIEYGKKLGEISFLLGAAISLVLLVSAKVILGFYELSSELMDLSFYTLMALCLVLPFKSYNGTAIVGIMRGGGDTKYCLILDIAALWLVGVPVAAVGGLKFSLPVYAVYLLTASEELIKFFFGVRRVKSKKWVRNLVKNLEDPIIENEVNI